MVDDRVKEEYDGQVDQFVVVDESWVDLKLKAFRSEMRLLVVISLLGNQMFNHVDIPTEVTGAALLAVILKLSSFAIGR